MKKWLFRILMIMIVIGGLALFGLQIVSGTSDKHKQGLEEAFSQIFQGSAKFGALKAFNLFPQFSIEIENLEISGIAVSGIMNIAKAEIGFGPIDLILKNRKIEKFYLKDLTISAGVYTPLSLKLADAGIYKDEATGNGKFAFSGNYGTHPINGQIDMAVEGNVRPKYFFNEKNNLILTINAVVVKAAFSPYATTGPEISQITLSGEGKNMKMECSMPSDKIISLQKFMSDVIAKSAEIQSTSDLEKLCNNLKI